MLSGFRNEQPNISIKKVYLTFYILKSLIEYLKKNKGFIDNEFKLSITQIT